MQKKIIENEQYRFSAPAPEEECMIKTVKHLCVAAAVFALTALTIMLSGCNGGSGGVSSEVVMGTAAVGAPLSGHVSLKDASIPSQERSSTIGSDGTFAIDVTGMKAPYVLQAKGSAAGENYTLTSFAEGAGTANVNPLSDVIVASAATAAGDDDPEDLYEHADSDIIMRIKANFARVTTILMGKLQPLLKQYHAEHVHPVTSRYFVNHRELDDMFDHVKITIKEGVFSILNKESKAVIFSAMLSDIVNGTFNDTALPPTVAAPAAPAGLSAIGGTGQMTLSWNTVSTATAYNLYYASAPGVTAASGTKIAAVSTPHVQTGLAAGSTYYYVVTAVNSGGESAASNEVQAVTAATLPAPSVPAAPTGVIAAGGTNQVTVSWSADSSVPSYNVYYATSSGVTKAGGTKIADATNPVILTGLAAGTTYYYIVTGVNSAGEGPPSAQVAASTLAAPPAAICGSCHAIPPALGRHAVHASAGYDCAICHGAGYSKTAASVATHMNGVKNVSLSVWNSMTRTCSSYCHGGKAW